MSQRTSDLNLVLQGERQNVALRCIGKITLTFVLQYVSVNLIRVAQWWSVIVTRSCDQGDDLRVP
jgi:hypothetical protein